MRAALRLVPLAALIAASAGSAAPGPALREQTAKPPFDVRQVIETVQHRFAREKGRLVADDRTYNLGLTRHGAELAARGKKRGTFALELSQVSGRRIRA